MRQHSVIGLFQPISVGHLKPALLSGASQMQTQCGCGVGMQGLRLFVVQNTSRSRGGVARKDHTSCPHTNVKLYVQWSVCISSSLYSCPPEILQIKWKPVKSPECCCCFFVLFFSDLLQPSCFNPVHFVRLVSGHVLMSTALNPYSQEKKNMWTWIK